MWGHHGAEAGSCLVASPTRGRLWAALGPPLLVVTACSFPSREQSQEPLAARSHFLQAVISLSGAMGQGKASRLSPALTLHRKRSPASRGAVPQFPHMPRGDNPLATQDVSEALRDQLLRGFITRELEPWDTRLADNSSHPKAGV